MKKIYVTTPIYYPSGAPHLGSAYTSVACDVYARFKRQDGYDVKFLTGTDEHGLKLQRKAEEQGISPQEYVDKMSNEFRALTEIMHLSNTDFIRTTEPRHHKAAQALWRKLEANGYIYKSTYQGWYSVPDEAYFDEDELTEENGVKLAPSGHKVEWIEEESYFFKLSAFQEKLENLYKTNPNFVQPKNRLNEVKSFVSKGLKDISISRTTFNWGIPVPGDDKHIMYVWIDALTNYLTSDGYPNDWPNPMSHWPATHVVGKDILRFHAVYWPSMLMGADIALPKQIQAHGWWTSEGKKMSKSFNNVVNPKEICDKYGTDQIRYFLLKEVPFGNDGDFSETRLQSRINAELANDIGNLFQRTLSMINKQCDGKIPALLELSDLDKNLFDLAEKTVKNARKSIENFEFHQALESIWTLVSAGNQYMEKTQPWTLKKEQPEQMKHHLRVLMEALRTLALLVEPFMPTAGKNFRKQLGIAENNFAQLETIPNLPVAAVLPPPFGVFPRVEIAEAV